MTNGNKKIQLATNLILKMFFLLFLFFRGKSNNLICHYFSRQVSLIRQYGIFQNLLRNLSATRSQSHVQRTMSRQSTSRYWTKFRSSLQILHCPTHFESWHYRLLGGAIHILCKHSFLSTTTFSRNLWAFFFCPKGQLNSEWIHEVILCPKIPTKNYRDFCPGSLLLQGYSQVPIKRVGWIFWANFINK